MTTPQAVASAPELASAVRRRIEEYGQAVAAHEHDGKFEHAAQFRLDVLMKELEPLLATGALPAPEPLPMDTAPTDGTIVRLLVDYSGEDACNPLEDAEPATPRWTIGANTDSNHPDEPAGWLMAGWNWEQDCFWQGHGNPIGWLPFAATPAAVVGGTETNAEPQGPGYIGWFDKALEGLAATSPSAAPAERAWENPPPHIEGRLEVWLTAGSDDLNPHTKNLVVRFARAMAKKLLAAEQKYGYTDGWRSPDWMAECRTKLLEHVSKGDPRDVAAYCAFLWHHGASTAQLETFLKVERDGSFLVCEAHELTDMLGEDPGSYTLTLVQMTRAAFEALPEFEGF